MYKLLALQHILPSTAWLLGRLANHPDAGNMQIVGKPYSTIPTVAAAIRAKGMNLRDCLDQMDWTGDGDLLLLDEGGVLHDRAPTGSCRAAVEQTSSGVRRTWRHPTVLVCRSAAKLTFEAQVVARGIIRKLASIGVLDGRRVGVIGLGALGSEIAYRLAASGHDVCGADIRRPRGSAAEFQLPLEEVLGRADLLLGCTGVDCLQSIDLSSIHGERLYASCSSSNVEFRSVLRKIHGEATFQTVRGTIGAMSCVVLNGGYPVNFDRLVEWEDPMEIQLTRRLCLAGLDQAAGLDLTRPKAIMLDPTAQLQIVEEWLEDISDSEAIRRPSTLTLDFFARNSEGELIMSKRPSYTLHQTTPAALERMRSHQSSYEARVGDLSIVVLPGVWSPAYDWSSLLMIDALPTDPGLDVLEVGSGTGVVAVAASLRGARSVVAVDVNPQAVENTKLNFERFGRTNGTAFASEGFANVTGKFDLVVFNAPYHGSRPVDLLERGCADEDYRGITSFFRGVREHLAPGGVVLFGFSESGDMARIEQLIDAAGLRLRKRLSDWRDGYNAQVLVLDETLEKATDAEAAKNSQ